MLCAFQIGISLRDYEEMTPYELYIAIKAFQLKKEAETQALVTQAWLTEYYHRLKKLMPLHEALSKLNKSPKKQMTESQMKEQVMKLNALLGGNVIEKGSE